MVQANLAVLNKGASVFVGDEPEAREIVRRAGTDERPILRLAGAESRNDAEALRGQQLSVSFDDAPRSATRSSGRTSSWAARW